MALLLMSVFGVTCHVATLAVGCAERRWRGAPRLAVSQKGGEPLARQGPGRPTGLQPAGRHASSLALYAWATISRSAPIRWSKSCAARDGASWLAS